MRMFIILLLLLAAPANAQTVMDSSDKSISAANLTELKTFLEDKLTDPYSAQIRRLKKGWTRNLRGGERDPVVCGEVNSKTPFGGYGGFKPFMMKPERPSPLRVFSFLIEGEAKSDSITATLGWAPGRMCGQDFFTEPGIDPPIASPEPPRRDPVVSSPEPPRPNPKDQILGLLKSQIQRCVTLPMFIDGYVPIPSPIIRFSLEPDGTLKGVPELLNGQQSQRFASVSNAVTKAIQRCSPYRIPQSFSSAYEEWKTLTVQFDVDDGYIR